MAPRCTHRELAGHAAADGTRAAGVATGWSKCPCPGVGSYSIIQPVSSRGPQVPFLPVLGHTQAVLVKSKDSGAKLSEFKCAPD